MLGVSLRRGLIYIKRGAYGLFRRALDQYQSAASRADYSVYVQYHAVMPGKDKKMFKNILLPTDGSPLSRRAVKDGIQLAGKLRARVTGFYVTPAFHVQVSDDMLYVPPEMLNARVHAASAQKIAQRHLEFISNAASDHHVRCTCHFVISDAVADAIVNAARKHKCDLIYMGSHGRSGLSKLLLGSQASKVLALTRIPVLVHR